MATAAPKISPLGVTSDGRTVHAETKHHHKSDTWYDSINSQIAVAITAVVGTMWCAYVFAGIALTSLPSTLAQHSVQADVQWLAQTFLQLVLLSIILVGQNVAAKASDARAAATLEGVNTTVDGLRLDTMGGIRELYDKLHAENEDLRTRLATLTPPAS